MLKGPGYVSGVCWICLRKLLETGVSNPRYGPPKTWILATNKRHKPLKSASCEKKKVTSFKTMYIIELQHKMSFFRENPYIGHTCAILFFQSHTTWAVVTYKSQKVTRPCCIHEHRNDSGQMKYSLNIDLHRPNTSLAPSPRQSLPDLPGVWWLGEFLLFVWWNVGIFFWGEGEVHFWFSHVHLTKHKTHTKPATRH